DQAVIAFQKAISLPDDVSGTPTTTRTAAHNNLGVLLQGQGKLTEAERAFMAAVAIDPNYEFAKNNLAAVRRQLSQPVSLAYSDTRYRVSNDPFARPKLSVVFVKSFFTPDGQGESGTGLIVRRSGSKVWILTARHILMDSKSFPTPRQCDSVQVLIYLGNKPSTASVTPIISRKIKIVNEKVDLDLALIEIDAPNLPADIQPLPFSSNAKEQSPITVIGHPGDEEWQVIQGKITDVSASDGLQLKAGLSRGNSGGPILNQNFEILGIAVSILPRNVVFAIPSDRILKQLKEWGITVP
ncbi:MAG: trypsin-like peptidase domain-containing protein, partial [Leptolyngbyaceae cyanobacterium CAN_BIN12]|nr:trypsin-like peptidase domain-containing protein [Leptolyngbyaceae cyanobacterium CAN_BIN12]